MFPRIPRIFLEINEYGSNLDPQPMEQASIFGISISNSSSNLLYETSHSSSRSQSQTSDGSALLTNAIETDPFLSISRLLKEKIEFFGGDLPPNWSDEEFCHLVIGEEALQDPFFLNEIYLDLLEHGFYSFFWEQAFNDLQLIWGAL